MFVNVVGDIKPEQLALLGEKLHIDPLKKIGKVTHKEEQPEHKEPVEEKDKKTFSRLANSLVERLTQYIN